jgi:hypothetical protein
VAEAEQQTTAGRFEAQLRDNQTEETVQGVLGAPGFLGAGALCFGLTFRPDTCQTAGAALPLGRQRRHPVVVMSSSSTCSNKLLSPRKLFTEASSLR